MTTRRCAFGVSLAAASLGLCAPAHAQAPALYKSVGKDGVVTYSDQPPADGKIDKVLTFEYLPRSDLPAATASRLEQLRKASSAAAHAVVTPSSQVRIYTAAWCGYCKLAKAYLNSHGIAFDDFDIDTVDGLKAYARAGGGRGIPLMLVGDQRVQGFSEKAYDTVLHVR
jgi:glutaredoxin